MIDYSKINAELSEICLTIGAPKLTSPLTDLLHNPDQSIFVAVLGQFKSGKSSFINSLLGKDLLPSGVVPVTAIVTRIRYGDTNMLTVLFEDDTQITTDIAALPLYVTEKHNPENIKKVKQAVIDYPGLEPFHNINLIDTPGLGSLYRHNTIETLQWIPFTGYAIICISTERPLSDEDISLMKGIRHYCPEIAIVLTKTDLFDHAQLDEITSYINTSLSKNLPADIPVFPFSVFYNSENHRNTIFQNILVPLQQNTKQKLEKLKLFKTHYAVEQSLMYANLSLQTAIKRKTGKDAVASVLNDITSNRRHIEREMLTSGSSFKNEIRDKLEKIIMPHRVEISGKLSIQFKNDYFLWKGSLFGISRQFESWLQNMLHKEIAAIDQICFDPSNKIIKETAGYYHFSALRFRQQIDDKLFHAFGIHLPEAVWQIDFAGIDIPDISIYRAFDSHIDILLFFLPVRMFRKLIFRHFSRQIPFETEKNLQRYISDLNEKMIKTIDRIHRQALQYMANEIATVENILNQSPEDIGKIQTIIEKLEAIKKSLN